jgi:hypothetical protein
MVLLEEDELAGLRATAAEALDTTAIVETQTFVSDGGGGGTTAWIPAGTFAARLAPFGRAGGEDVEGDRIAPDSELVMTFPADTPIDHNAQIICDGNTFTVVAVRSRSQELTRRVIVKEIE